MSIVHFVLVEINSLFSKETSTSKIDLPEDDPYHIGLMIDYFYTRKYDPHPTGLTDEQAKEYSEPQSPRFEPKTHIVLYALGDKYAVPALSSYAAEYFMEDVGSNCGVADFLHCVPLVYNSTPDTDRTLRGFLLERIILNFKYIAEESEVKERMMELVHSIEQFREDLCLGFLRVSVAAGDSFQKWNGEINFDNDLAMSVSSSESFQDAT